MQLSLLALGSFGENVSVFNSDPICNTHARQTLRKPRPILHCRLGLGQLFGFSSHCVNGSTE